MKKVKIFNRKAQGMKVPKSRVLYLTTPDEQGTYRKENGCDIGIKSKRIVSEEYNPSLQAKREPHVSLGGRLPKELRPYSSQNISKAVDRYPITNVGRSLNRSRKWTPYDTYQEARIYSESDQPIR